MYFCSADQAAMPEHGLWFNLDYVEGFIAKALAVSVCNASDELFGAADVLRGRLKSELSVAAGPAATPGAPYRKRSSA